MAAPSSIASSACSPGMSVLVARFTNLLRRAKSLSDRLRDAARRIERPKATKAPESSFAFGSLSPSRPSRRFSQPPELSLTNHLHDVPFARQTPNLKQLRTSRRARNLQCVRPTAHQHVRRWAGFPLHDRARFFRGADRFAPPPAQKTCERDPLSLETHDAAEM